MNFYNITNMINTSAIWNNMSCYSITTNSCIYIYDVATGKVTKGVSIAAGYYFDQIRLFED